MASADGWVHFVDLKTWDLSGRIPVFADVPPHCAGVIAFSPDDTRIVAATEHFSAYGQLPKPVRVVSATDGRVIASHKGDQLTRFVAWLPASGLVAFAGVDGKLVLWDPDVPGASMLAKQVSPLGNAFATTADGRRLAVAEGETLELFQINR